LTVSPGAATCLKDAGGVVIDHTFGNVENLEVIVHGLPPMTDFVLFVIQVPNAPFGLAWYNGDILTDDTGTGVINVVGRFNIGTFIVSLGAVPSPDVFPAPPAVLANSKTGAVTNPTTSLARKSFRFNRIWQFYVKCFNSFYCSNPLYFKELVKYCISTGYV